MSNLVEKLTSYHPSEANMRNRRIFLAVVFAAALFDLVSVSGADANWLFRRRQTCQVNSCGIPWYALCYKVVNESGRPDAPTCTCTPPTNDPTANYCVCCKGGQWVQYDTGGPCESSCFCIHQGDNASTCLGPCAAIIRRTELTGSQVGCNCAYVFDTCMQKLRYAYPCEYNNPIACHVVYGPAGAVSGACCN
jgi:hypothetical protein